MNLQLNYKLINPCILCEKFGGLHLAELVLMLVSNLSGKQADEIQVRFKAFKACCA